MKNFRFKYSITVWILLAVVLALLSAGLAYNIFNLTQYVNAGVFKIIVYSIIIALTGFLTVFVICVMTFSAYRIKNGYLYTFFGFIVSKEKIENVMEIIHFKKSDKLVAYFSDDKYTVIVISPALYENFVLAMRKANPKIAYGTRIDGEDTPI